MTAAAEKLMISQSAISSQLKQLEQTMDSTLFRRQPRGIELTAAGKILAEYARRIFDLVGEAEAAVKDVQGLRRGTLRIGASPVISAYFLPPLLVHFQRRFPHIRLEVEAAEVDVLMQRVQDGLLDLGLGPVVGAAPDVDLEPFMQEKFVAVVGRDHPLARRRSPTAEELARAFVSRQLPSATGSMSLGYFQSRGLSVRPVISLGSVEAVKQAVVAGMGASIMSEMAVGPELANKRIRILRLEGFPLKRTLYCSQRKVAPSKAAIAFRCLLKHAARGTLNQLRPR